MPRTLARGWPLVSRSPFPRQHRAATGRNADLPLRLFGPIGGLCVPSLRKLRKWWFGFFFPAEQKEFLKPGYPRLTAAKRRSAQSKERTPETTERRHRRLEHRRVIRETRGRISPIPTPGRPPREITRTHLSPGTFQATFHVVLSRRRRVDGSRARARAPGRRARPPRRCRQTQRVDAQGTRPTTDPSHASPFSPKVPRSGRVACAASRRGRRDNLLRGLPGFGGVSPETYRAYRAVPGRPNVSRRSHVVTRSPHDPERRPEDRVEHPLTRSTPPRVTLRRRPP